MTNEMWKSEYVNCLHKGKYSEANRIKFGHMPSKLYRFEKFEQCRIETLLKECIYVTHSCNYDDPYDAKGYWWDSDKLEKMFCTANMSVTPKEYIQNIETLVNSWFERCWICCLTEDINNFPMWYYYADKYQGFCVEYDVSNLQLTDAFQQGLNPVIYQDKKIDLTVSLQTVFAPPSENNTEEMLKRPWYWLHIIGNTIKDESWEFEKEWRYVTFDDDFDKKGKLVKIPVKPSHIFCGYEMSENKVKVMKNVAAKLGCECTKINITDFHNREFVVH